MTARTSYFDTKTFLFVVLANHLKSMCFNLVMQALKGFFLFLILQLFTYILKYMLKFYQIALTYILYTSVILFHTWADRLSLESTFDTLKLLSSCMHD